MKLSLAGNVVKRQKKKNVRKWPKNGRKMIEKWPKLKPKRSRDEAPIYIVYTAHFSLKMVER